MDQGLQKAASKSRLKKITSKLSSLPNRKIYLDFFAAFLSIPVLLTVIIGNVHNLQIQNADKTVTAVTPQPTVESKSPIIILTPAEGTNQSPANITPAPATPAICKKQVGPVVITYPQENQTVTDNPLCIIIRYDDPNYCSVVWSYRINNGNWSDYSSNSVCLYNVPNGNIKFDLRVQSTASQDQTILQRDFSYAGSSATLTPTSTPPTSTSSAQLSN